MKYVDPDGLAAMMASQRLIDFLAAYEGGRSADGMFHPYRGQDSQNQTIGYGHVIRPGESFGVLSQEQAMDLLMKDLAPFVEVVNDNTEQLDLRQEQFDALVSLTYNIGPTGFEDSTVLRMVQASESDEKIKKALLMWVKCNGEFSVGLWRRRMDEFEMYSEGDYQRDYPNPNKQSSGGVSSCASGGSTYRLYSAY